MLSRFTFGFKDLILTAFKLAVGKLPRTIVMALLLIEAASLSLKYVFPLAFVPALTALLTSLFTEPVFKAYGGGLKNADAEPEAPDEADGE